MNGDQDVPTQANEAPQPPVQPKQDDGRRTTRVRLTQFAPAAVLVLALCAVGIGLTGKFLSSRPLDLSENVAQIDSLIKTRLEQSVWAIKPIGLTQEKMAQAGVVWLHISRQYELPPVAEVKTAVTNALRRVVGRAGAELRVVSDDQDGMLLSVTFAGAETHTLRFSTGMPSDDQKAPVAAVDAPQDAPAIAIIVDDLGYGDEAAKQLSSLGVPLTVSVLPKLGASRKYAEIAREAGLEVMLHLPMATGAGEPPEPGEIQIGMSRDAVARLFEENLATVPGAVGVNNHKGSQLTTLETDMSTFMSVLGETSLYFVDSLTTSESVALDVAREFGLKAIRNDIFLDNERDMVNIEVRLNELMRTADRRGYAVGICHAKTATVDALRELLPALQARGFRLVPVSELLEEHG
jgi:polysaccharide deacetylase 2 family uncharacterized protein YibQ